MDRISAIRKQFSAMLKKEDIIIAPGCYDALSARIVEATGHNCVYMTGFGTSASLLGLPDMGFITMPEIIDNARRIAGAVNIPVIADADTGYGNPLNVYRTVKEYERSGVAAIHIEDQTFPKRCGHLEGKEVVDPEEMVQKIKAACDARTDDDFKIIARTDARAVMGLDDAIARARKYYKAGADIIFVESPYTVDEFKYIAKELHGIPLLANMAEGGKSPMLSANELRQMGYKIVIFPVGLLFAASQAMYRLSQEIKEKGTNRDAFDHMWTFKQFTDFIGVPKCNALSEKYRSN